MFLGVKFYYDLSYGSPGNAISLYNDNFLETFDITLNSLYSNHIDNNYIELANYLSRLDNDKFKSYISLLKSILIALNKYKIGNFDSNNYLSDKFRDLKTISNSLSKKNIIDRYEFLSMNELDLFTLNLDKRLFMLKFLTS